MAVTGIDLGNFKTSLAFQHKDILATCLGQVPSDTGTDDAATNNDYISGKC